MKRMLSKYWQNKTSKLPNCICAQCSVWNKNDGYSGIKTRVNKYSTIVKFLVLGSIRLETAQICCQNYFMPSFVFSNLVAMCLFPALNWLIPGTKTWADQPKNPTREKSLGKINPFRIQKYPNKWGWVKTLVPSEPQNSW
jgi:hypothetical protein